MATASSTLRSRACACRTSPRRNRSACSSACGRRSRRTRRSTRRRSTSRRATPPVELIPLLGVDGDEIATIPFFAAARVDTSSVSMDTQTDAPNRRTIKPDSLGAETDAYFGCWLDINQPGELRFPDRMVGGNPANIPGGPFTGMGALLSIQQLVRSTHQCLIAEISYSPGSGHDWQRSVGLGQARAAKPHPRARPEPRDAVLAQGAADDRDPPTPVPLAPGSRPDELMIEWGAIPAGTSADLDLPAASAAEILELLRRCTRPIASNRSTRTPSGCPRAASATSRSRPAATSTTSACSPSTCRRASTAASSSASSSSS